MQSNVQKMADVFLYTAWRGKAGLFYFSYEYICETMKLITFFGIYTHSLRFLLFLADHQLL